MGTPRSTKIKVAGDGLVSDQLNLEATQQQVLEALTGDNGEEVTDILKEIVSKLQILNGKIGLTNQNNISRQVIDSGVLNTLTTVTNLVQLSTGNYSTLPTISSDMLSRLNGQFTLR